MSGIPRDLHAQLTPQGLQLKIGDHELPRLPIGREGPIVEDATSDHPNRAHPGFVPLLRVWVPFLVEGTVHDSNAVCKVVHDGEAGLVGLPFVDQPTTRSWSATVD